MIEKFCNEHLPVAQSKNLVIDEINNLIEFEQL